MPSPASTRRAQAADYLDAALDGKTIGIGGSITVQEMGLADRLAKHNTVLWHWKTQDPTVRREATDGPGVPDLCQRPGGDR